MNLPQHSELHLWHLKLNEDLYQKASITLLSAEEVKRAQRFRFEVHRKRFISARAGLRSILGLYLNISPKDVQILQTPEGKPFIENSELQFNLSHSHELALYAVTFGTRVGVDIEKMKTTYNEAVAKRFFSSEEYDLFSKLPEEQKRIDFYKIWTGKEAIVKALGEGLGFPLSSFSIPFQTLNKEVLIKTQTMETWYLENMDLFPGYQAAYATNHLIKELAYFEWTPEGEKKWRDKELRSPT
jgi:4'-phosphopantetheinyl transferase